MMKRRGGVFSSTAMKHAQSLNGKLETLEDFGDDAIAVGVDNNNKKKYKLVAPTAKKPKFASGDDDIPMRDDIGERRRKYEMKVLAGADGLSSHRTADEGLVGESDSDIEYYKQVERKHASKLASKAAIYSRTIKSAPQPEALVDGKRHIGTQIEKNRGLTRPRKKLIKNPRKKYKLKYEDAKKRRKGQVRPMRQASGPYGGEASGINTSVCKSVKFKN